MTQREAALQEACVKWFRLQFPKLARLLIAVPNGGSRHVAEAVNLKRQGVMKGAADLLLLVPSKNYGALAIEMKYGKGRQSTEQKKWQKDFEAAGNQYTVCYTIEEFISTIKNYLGYANR